MDTLAKPSRTAALKKPNRTSKSDSIAESGSIENKASKASSESTLNRVSQTELIRFCSRKLFYIFFAAQADDESIPALEELINIGNDYKEVSSVTFITRKDVLSLLNVDDGQIFPNQLKPLLLNVIESAGNDLNDVNLQLEIQLVKLKLIQIMYQQYVDQVKKNEKEKTLDSLLNTLSKECRKKQKKEEHAPGAEENKTKSPRKDDKDVKKNKKEDKAIKENKEEEVDYTSIPLDKDSITFEENIFDYIWFYCLVGFDNADIIQLLIEQVNVPICGVIKWFTQLEPSSDNTFWKRIKECFFDNTSMYKSLENTIIMRFVPSTLNSLNTLEEFVFMLRKIINVKLTYLNYLRHLTINKVRHSYAVAPLECLKRYNKCLKYIPPECINCELILDAILREVDSNLHSENGSSSSTSYSMHSSYQSVQCLDPLYDFQRCHNSNSNKLQIKDEKGFLTHDHDVLMKILKSYKHVGSNIAKITLDFIKLADIFQNLDQTNEADDIIHFHDKDPAANNKINNDYHLENFMYIFLFNNISTTQFDPLKLENSLSILHTFDVKQYWDEIQTKCEENSLLDGEESTYDTSIINFRWKEIINTKDLMIQEVYKATNDFLYADKSYSPETSNFLVICSDKLDDFGINTKMYNVPIRTPVCIRDFCRYASINEDQWIEENVANLDETTFKVKFEEHCPGAQNIRTNLKIFDEYSHLLTEDVKEDQNDDNETLQEEAPADEQIIPAISFSDMLRDLTSNIDIISQCENAIENKQLLAYDFGTAQFKITGKQTTFCSHDNVKVVVDNSRLLQHPEKCTFKLICNENTLILHATESLMNLPYVSTLCLKDGTRISLVMRQNTDDEKLNYSQEEVEEEVDNVIYSNKSAEKLTEEEIEEEEEERETIVANEEIIRIPKVVRCVDEDLVKASLLEGQSLDNIADVNDNYEDLLDALLNLDDTSTIYKINTKSNYLKRHNNDLKIPLEIALRNIAYLGNIASKQSKTYEKFTKRFESDSPNNKVDLEVHCLVDFRICLPNGLYIRPHSSVVNKNKLIIKQEYADQKPDVPLVQHEEFRLFSSQGFVLMKKVDGTISILKANGDIIDFEKLTDGSVDDSSVKPCHCATLEDYRKKLNKLLKDMEQCDFTTSRRGHIQSKQNHILDSKLLKLLEQFDVPYLKKSITRFDGRKIKIQGDKITQKQLYYLTSQQDFFTGEISLERNDGFRSMFYKDGSQKNTFPDGTVIWNSIDINADELVDDFVFVNLYFKYEHPYYATVKFNFDKSSEIELNNDVTLKERDNCFTIYIKEELLSVSIANDNISVEKGCPQCPGLFEAKFNTKPFRENTNWSPSEQFLWVRDSYGKEFTSDMIGNCSKNNNFTKGISNEHKCNHFLNMQYKKLFVINKDLTGQAFYTNESVKTKIEKAKTAIGSSVENYNMVSKENVTTVDIRQKFHTKFSDRFYNISSNPDSNEYYTTFQIFHKMFESMDQITELLANMWHVFFHEQLDRQGDTSIYKNLTRLANALENAKSVYEQELLQEEKELNEKRMRQSEENEKKRLQSMKCCCVKQFKTMEEKMQQWKKECNKFRIKMRRKKISGYFESEFYKTVE